MRLGQALEKVREARARLDTSRAKIAKLDEEQARVLSARASEEASDPAQSRPPREQRSGRLRLD